MARNSTTPDYSILNSLNAGIVRPKTSLFYQAGLAIVAATMLLLPVIYIALVGGVAYLVYHHAVYHWDPIMSLTHGVRSGHILIIMFLVYITPLLAGLVVVFFLFKPILARQPKQAQPLALSPTDNPLLFAFISRICDVVGAPEPKRIDLDCQMNASAGFRRGFLSLFSNDLVLTIGMPLAANFTTRELAGVIAHEFGHFTQGTGMRLSYIIRSIIAWFARVAYERDAWDEALESWSNEAEDIRVMAVVWVVQIAVWFSRLILKLLMFIGVIVGGFMLRQMEYDADAYEVKVAGSEAFESTMRKLATLEAAMDASGKQLAGMWQRTHTLPDNLPEFLRSAHEKLAPQVIEKINDTLGLHRTGIFDSHPSPADRIRQARRAGDPGIFHDERPAAELFGSFEHPARFVTLLHYTDDLGIPITADMLTHIEGPSSGTHSESATSGDLCREAEEWALGLLPFLLPLELKTPSPSADVDAEASELAQISGGLQQIQEQLRQYREQDAAIADRLATLRAAGKLVHYGAAWPASMPEFSDIDAASVVGEEENGRKDQEALHHSLREVLSAVRRRLDLGISLAFTNADSISDQPKQITDLVNWLNAQRPTYLRQKELAEALAVLEKLNAVRAAQGESPELLKAIDAQTEIAKAVQTGMEPPKEVAPPKARLRVQLGDAPRPESKEASAMAEQNRKWFAAYQRKVAELIEIASAVETAQA